MASDDRKSMAWWVRKTDAAVVPAMARVSHRAERWLIGLIFIWFGSLKILGEASATSIIAKSVYWWDPAWVVPGLGFWELVMGACLLFPSTVRVALLLFFLRLPGTVLAFAYHWDECFTSNPLVPTIQGQYLLKELTLVGAALVIGGNIRLEREAPDS